MAKEIGSTMLYVMILNAVILAISYWVMNKDNHDGSIIDLQKSLMSSIYLSMENAVIGFFIAFVLAAIVIGLASNSSQRDHYGVWKFIVWLVALLFATTIWGLALNAMGKLWGNLQSVE